jgi:hypothetical protein
MGRRFGAGLKKCGADEAVRQAARMGGEMGKAMKKRSKFPQMRSGLATACGFAAFPCHLIAMIRGLVARVPGEGRNHSRMAEISRP